MNSHIQAKEGTSSHDAVQNLSPDKQTTAEPAVKSLQKQTEV